jgi:iron complex outermembrane receptor protein
MRLRLLCIQVIWVPVLMLGQKNIDPGPDSLVFDDTIVLEDVSISVLPFRETYREATGGLFVLDAGETEMGQEITISELINLAPGIHMSEGTYSTTRLVIRGVGSRTPYSSNRIRAYLDDVPLTTGDGISTVEDLDPLSIGMMEIVKGPSSALYGSGLGGVVRLNTPYPSEEGLNLSLSGEVGSFRTGKTAALGSFKNKRIAVHGGISRSFSEGYRENSRYTRNNLFLSGRYFGRKNTLSLTLSLVDLFARIPSSLNEPDFENQPWKAADNWNAVKGFEEYLKFLGGMKLESELGNRLTNHAVLFSSFSDPYESRPFNILDDQAVSAGFREYLQLNLQRVKLSMGVEYFHEWYKWQIYETLEGSRGELQSEYRETRKYFNGFALLQWRPTRNIVVDGAINLNMLRYGLETVFRTDSTDQSGSYRYDPVFSPRLGISYRYHSLHYLYASAGHGFSAPSLEETLLPEGEINTDLKPETGWNLEVGSRGSMLNNSLEYDLTLYTIFLDNLLVTERVTEDIFTGANAGSARNAGVEARAHYTLHPPEGSHSKNASLSLGYTLSGNIFTSFIDDGTDYTGNVLPGIPAQRINAVFRGMIRPVRLQVHYQYTGGQWMDDANLNRYKGYQLLHMQLAWRHDFNSLPIGLEVYGGIRNLFDTHYASMLLINAPSFGGSLPRYYYPGLPRHYFLGIRFNVTGNRTHR